MVKARTFVVCAGLLALLLPRPAAAAWPTDPNVNVPVCTADSIQYWPVMVSDSAGGAIVAWVDGRSGSRSGSYDIYAQRISADGTPLWAADGVAICTATGGQSLPDITSDGSGGAIVAWEDRRSGTNYDIYAQRISADGTPLWAADGVAICTATYTTNGYAVVSDEAGGAIVAWVDHRSGISSDDGIYAQRISAAGTSQWTADGVALCIATGRQYLPIIISDGAGGAIVAWTDERSGTSNGDIYAQRILAAGTVQWATDGVALCTATGNQSWPSIASDGAGGAIATWRDYRSGTGNGDIYAQRILAAGTVQWEADGVALYTATSDQSYATITSDSAGGAIVTWRDYRSGTSNGDIYAQRISGDGTSQWAADGVAICTASGNQLNPIITPDGAGGAIVAWVDQRSGNFIGNSDIYAQRISATGTVQWTADGVAICTASGDQKYPLRVVSDGAGGAVVAWKDDRNGFDIYNWPLSDIYAQNVKANGELGGYPGADVPTVTASLAFALDPVRPNPSRGGTLTVHFSLPTGTPARLELLDVAGRRIASHDVGMGQHTLDLGQGQHLAPGLYLVRLTQGANTRTTRVAVLQ
jgi:predicted lipoprotein with Yx(FWY)xxD motif